MEYVLIKDIKNSVLGDIYEVEYAYTENNNKKLYFVCAVSFSLHKTDSYLISEQELNKHFIPLVVYRRNKIIKELL